MSDIKRQTPKTNNTITKVDKNLSLAGSISDGQIDILSNLTRKKQQHDLLIPTLFMMMGTLSIVSGIYSQHKKFHSVLTASFFANAPLIYALTATFQAIERISAYIEHNGKDNINLQNLIKPLQNIRTGIFALLSVINAGASTYGIITKKDPLPLPIDIFSIAGSAETIAIAGLLCQIDALNSSDKNKRKNTIKELSNLTNGLFSTLGLTTGASGIYGLSDKKDPVLSSISLINGILTGIISAKFISLGRKQNKQQIALQHTV